MSLEPTSSQNCPKCGATFFNGRLYWASGKPGDARDLAGLVCQNWGDATCINPMRYEKGGDTWAKRKEFMDVFGAELDLPPIQ